MTLDELALQLYGITPRQAWHNRICISCKRDITWTSEIARKEYYISALCETCFDAITAEVNDDKES